MEMIEMPKEGFTTITVSVALKDRLSAKSKEMGFRGVPSLIEAFLNGTGTSTGTAKTENLPPFQNCTSNWSLGRALIPRPPPYQGGAPPG